MTPIEKALHLAYQYGTIDGAHHKQWLIDQMVRALTESPETGEGSPAYVEFVGDDGEWDEGIAP